MCIRDSYTMPYRLFVPEGYDSTKIYPLVLFLHGAGERGTAVSYTHLRAHETVLDLVCRLLLEKKTSANTQPSCRNLALTQI